MTPPNSAPDERMVDRDVERKMRVMSADCFFHVSDEDRAVIRQAADLLAQHRALMQENERLTDQACEKADDIERLEAEALSLEQSNATLTAQLERLKTAAEKAMAYMHNGEPDILAQCVEYRALAQATTEKGEG